MLYNTYNKQNNRDGSLKAPSQKGEYDGTDFKADHSRNKQKEGV